MGRRLRFARFAPLAASLLVALLPPAAAARQFQMSGRWIIRNGQVFIPLQFAMAPMDASRFIHASMGNLSGAFGFPNEPMPVLGGAEAGGSAPASLMIPKHRAVEDAMAVVPLAGVTLVQITTNFGVDGPYASATLGAGAGPGSFTWCPGDAACTAAPPPAQLATDPPRGAGRGGRIIYRAGPNQFGGTLQMGLKRGGTTTALFAAAPFRVGYNRFGGAGSEIRSLVPGAGSADDPATGMVFLERAFVTQPTMVPPPFNLILYPGPKLTVGKGLTNTGTGAVFYLPTVGVGPMGTLAGQITSHYGFAHTTGTVFAQLTTGSGTLDFFTFMGSDARTPLGAGNLSLVAGGLSFRNTVAGQTAYTSVHKIWLTLAAPIPSVSPGGFVAAAALVLLAAGYALRRRLA